MTFTGDVLRGDTSALNPRIKTYFSVSWVDSGRTARLELTTVRDYRPKQEEAVRRPRTPNIQLPDQLPPDLS